jgi:hypothetical protein
MAMQLIISKKRLHDALKPMKRQSERYLIISIDTCRVQGIRPLSKLQINPVGQTTHRCDKSKMILNNEIFEPVEKPCTERTSNHVPSVPIHVPSVPAVFGN